MHHTVLVIDESTKAADTENDDSVNIIRDAAVARQYLDEFDRMNAIVKVPNTAGITCPQRIVTNGGTAHFPFSV